MRPLNLIPPEERQGDRAPLRRGPLAYVLVGGLAAALVAVVAMVTFTNNVTEKQNELDALEAQKAAVTADAQALAPYAQFASMQAAREATIVSLADSRFDWERVLRELALVIPQDVWLTKLVGSAAGDGGEGVSALTQSVEGPALSFTGCGRDHEAVARFIAALEDIDGVTRVGLARTQRKGQSGGATCAGRNMPAQFEAVAAFDAVAVDPATAPATPAEPEADPEQEQVETPERQQAKNSAKQQSDKAETAANVVPGVAP